MDRREFLKLTGLTLAVAAMPRWLQSAAEAADTKPNIVFIYADDVGIGDVGCYGGPFPTPNIDALATGGTRFEYCYSTPLCGPSRCETLTGQYPFRTGLISNNSQNAVSPDRQIMIPTVLKKAGYTTASVGKWGQICLGPHEWGFDEYLVFQGSGHYWASQSPGYKVNGVPKQLTDAQYLPDVMHDFAVDFIDRHQQGPFFLYYPMSHVHGPILRTPDSKPGADAKQHYRDNIVYMDKLVGKLMTALDQRKLRENTLVIYTGDNGTARFGISADATVHGRPISGQKGTMLEGGSRVPLIANWPGTTPAKRVKSDLVDFSDFFGTFAAMGGAPLPAGVTLDGHSFAPQLHGQTGNPRDWVYVELNGHSYVRDAHYKLTNTGELFDMADAPFQEIPVPATTTDPVAIAARKKLQPILDAHPAATAGPKKANTAKRKARKAAKRKAGTAAE